MGQESRRSVVFADRPRVEYVMLANHAEAVNGLLYIAGGGWTDHYRQITPGQPPPISQVGIALSVYVPWSATNRPLKLKVKFENDDGSELLKVDATLNTGRPPQLVPGAAQHAALAFNFPLPFPKPGGYRVVATLDDAQDVVTWPFRVHDVQQHRLAS